jgi:DNA repair ATPase RecN
MARMKKGSKTKLNQTSPDFFKYVKNQFMLLDERLERGFAQVQKRMDDEFEQVSSRFERIERGVRALQTGQEILDERVGDIQRRVGNLEIRVEDIRDTLGELAGAEEKDAEATMNHEGRITHLEKLSNIRSLSPKHLAGLG